MNVNNFNTQIGSLAGGGSTGGNVILGTANLTTGADNTSPTYGGSISGSGTLAKIGSGTQTLTGINTYTGDTTISAGGLTIGGAGQLNSGAYAGNISNSGTFNYNSSAAQTLSGAISGAGSLTQTGAGTLTLSGNSGYTGPTTVTAGTLIVSGSLTGSVSALVASGGTLEVDGLLNNSATATLTDTGALQGTGSVGGITASGGTVSPGLTAANAFSSTGTLTAAGTVTLSSTTNFNIRLGMSGPGTDSDQLAINGGTIDLGSSTLNLTLGPGMSNLTPDSINTLYYVIVNGGSNPVTGMFAGLPNLSTININGGYSFQIFYNTDAVGNSDAGIGNDVVLEVTAIPEPGTCATMLCSLGMLIAAQRIRRRTRA